MKFNSKEKKKSRLFTVLTYITAFLSVVSIVLQALNQYLILPSNVKSVLNNLIIISVVFLSIAVLLLLISISPFLIYRRRKINLSMIRGRNNSYNSTEFKKEKNSFAENPIKYFMKSLKDDEIKETLK